MEQLRKSSASNFGNPNDATKNKASFDPLSIKEKPKDFKKARSDRNSLWYDIVLPRLTALVSQVYQATKKLEFWRLPPPRQMAASQRATNWHCEYHQTTGHEMEDCRHHKKFILKLMRNECLKEYLAN